MTNSVFVCVHVHFFTARDNVGTNLNLAFKTILERMAIQKLRNEMLFMEVHHVLIFFTDGTVLLLLMYICMESV